MTINRLNQGTTNQVLVKAISGQTTNLLELQDSSGNVVSSIGPTGALTGIGKILQVVRATDSTDRTTTSTSFVDASISVTITPQKNNSAILLIWASAFASPAGNANIRFQITDSSNTGISGAADGIVYSTDAGSITITTVQIGYATPNTTSATTYKGRFRAQASGTATINNNVSLGQLYAIEVAA
jgi:hypothetical protein